VTVTATEEPPVLLPISEVAHRLGGVHPRTVRRLIASGDLDGRRIGSKILRVTEASVLALIEARPIGNARPR